MDLEKLLYLQGVGKDFVDCDGQYHCIPPLDRERILKAMCWSELQHVSMEQYPQWVTERISLLDAKPWQELLSPVQWCYSDELTLQFHIPQQFSGPLQLQLQGAVDVTLRFAANDSSVTGDYFIDGVRYLRHQLNLAALLQTQAIDSLPLGYYQLALTALTDIPTSVAHRSANGLLVVAPRRSYGADLPKTAPSRRPWGVSLQLFSLWSSKQNVSPQPPASIGDFETLAQLIPLLAAEGADFIQLNPLHALPLQDVQAASPYSPYDRRRIHPLYISTELCPESTSSAWQALQPQRPPQDTGTMWIDYPAAVKVKVAELKALFKVFSGYPKEHPRQQAMQAFVAREGAALQFYARTQASECSAPWLKQTAFHLYLQFVAEEQLAFCQARASAEGMSIGLVRDLAVGALGNGTEVRQHPQQFCTHASIGAPPDPFAPQGQNWGLTPLDPVGLKQAGFEHFIELLRSNMRHCGALRIDHMMGLFRLWWWPSHDSTAEAGGGAYVYYPFEFMLAILLLESHLGQCMVIGEDLGLVPTEIIEPMYRGGIFSNELFYFCSDDGRLPQYSGYKPPHEYKPHALMMLANHDVPTMASWWQGKDLLVRHELGLYSYAALAHAQQQRQAKIHGLLRWLQDFSGPLPDAATFAALLPRWAGTVAGGQSELFAVALADLLAEEDAVNIPGTSQEYPNWRRRYSLPVSQFTSHPLFGSVLAAIRAARRRHE